jgi:hypothetical protein
MRAQRQHLAARQRRDLGAQRLQERRHGADVRQARRVGERERLLERSVAGMSARQAFLAPAMGIWAVQLGAAADDDGIHGLSLSREGGIA